MIIGVDYEFYIKTYFGVADIETFNKTKPIAEKYVKNYTDGKLKTIDNFEIEEDVKMCLCNVIDKIIYYKKSNGKAISSQSVGSMSENYALDSTKMSQDSDIHNIVRFWLGAYYIDSVGWI